MLYTCYDKRTVELTRSTRFTVAESGNRFSVAAESNNILTVIERFSCVKEAVAFLNWLAEKSMYSKGKFRYEDFEDEVLFCRDQ